MTEDDCWEHLSIWKAGYWVTAYPGVGETVSGTTYHRSAIALQDDSSAGSSTPRTSFCRRSQRTARPNSELPSV